MNNGISVVVCTYNRLDYLKKCLASLLAQNFADYEIIVVDDCSQDGTAKYLDEIKNEKIKVIHNSINSGLSVSRNNGIKAARFDTVAFIDDDCLADSDWLKNITDKFSESQADFVIGQTFYISKDYRGYFPERLVKNVGARWPMGCNIAYKKMVFEKIGYFDPGFFYFNNEDTEMAIRTVARGYTYTRALGAIVYHQGINWTIKSLLRSARNPSVWPVLKKKYPNDYLHFYPKIKFGLLVLPMDYLLIITLPILIPALFIRYLWHGKRDFKIFFIKWPVLLLARRYYIFKQAIKNRVWMF